MESGPPIDERISKEEMIEIHVSSGFQLSEEVPVNNEHYGLKFSLGY